jgi:inhibitor of cysteine peptidase
MLYKRLRITALLIVLILATIPTALCSTQATTFNNRVITIADNGTTIFLSQGETFRLMLVEKQSTGYSWQLKLSKGLCVTKEEIIQGLSGSGLDLIQQNTASSGSIPISQSSIIPAAGNPETHIWTIKLLKCGLQNVEGIYKRPWEQTTSKDQTFKLNIKVKNPTSV